MVQRCKENILIKEIANEEEERKREIFPFREVMEEKG